MATTDPLSGLTALGAAPATNDLLVLVDVDDPTQAPSGTTKNMTAANLFTAPTFTTSVTVTGTLSVSSTADFNALATFETGLASNVVQFRTAAGLTVSNSTGTTVGTWNDSTGRLTLALGLGITTGGINIAAGGATVTGGVVLTDTASQITPGATSLSCRNHANTSDNLLIADAGAITVRAGITHGSTTLLTTSVALTNGAAAFTASLTNAPAAGNPTKWVPINDNGTTRYIPSW